MFNSNGFYSRGDCRLCRTQLGQPVFSLPPTPLANSFMKTKEEALALPTFPLSVFACSKCGHHQLGVVVNPSLMFANYAYASGTSASFREHFAEYAKAIIDRYMMSSRFARMLTAEEAIQATHQKFKVLELGSNDGTMLRSLLGAGATSVMGVEPAQNLAQECNKAGLPTVPQFFDEQVARYGDVRDADFFVANNVLAHVDDFVGTLKALALTNARAGVFEVQYLGAHLDAGIWDGTYHEHLDYWRATELAKHLHWEAGWVVMDIEQVPTHGGSLRVWVERFNPNEPLSGPRNSRVQELLDVEAQRDWPVNWAALSETMKFERERIRSLLDGKKNVVVFGAPAKLTTLLYGLGLTNGINFSYAVDDSPLKQGLFTPGIGLEVSHPNRLLAQPPDAVLIGAWNFAKYIVLRVEELCPGVPIVTPFEK